MPITICTFFPRQSAGAARNFQDAGAYGRTVHLQPMSWVDDWPVIGDQGTPVLSHRKPRVSETSAALRTPPDSDEFNSSRLGMQWQWQANADPNWGFPSAALGVLRLICTPLPEGFRNFWDVPNLLLQKFPAPHFSATAKVTFSPATDGEKTGLIVMGSDYAYLALEGKAGALRLSQSVARNADRGTAEREVASAAVNAPIVFLRLTVTEGALCRFSFSQDGVSFEPIGEPFTAKPGRWIGAKMGLFAIRSGVTREHGYADYDWFRVE